MTGPEDRGLVSDAVPWSLLSASLAALLAVFWWTEIADLPPGELDAAALVHLRELVLAHRAVVTPLRIFMSAVTFLGAFPTLCALLVGVAVVLALTGERRDALLLLVGSWTGIGTANLLKWVVDRPRPFLVEHWTSFSSSSFPSGHTADSTVTYLLLGAVASRRVVQARIRAPLLALCVCLPVLVGFSRVLLGVHWPTDVLGGWALGSAWALLAERLRRSRSRSGAPHPGEVQGS